MYSGNGGVSRRHLVRHGVVNGRTGTSLSPQDGSPEPSHPALAKARIFTNSPTTQSRGPSRPKAEDSVDHKEEEKPEFDIRGTARKGISLVTNYFQVRKNAECLPIYQYRAEFDPAEDDKSTTKWIIIVTRRDAGDIDNLIRVMHKIKRDGLQMVSIVLANSATEGYAAVKKRLFVDYGSNGSTIPSQCFLAKNLKPEGLLSTATMMCVQMCTKLGREPWTVKFTSKSLMVIGFYTDVHESPQISSMVASVSATFTKYYSTIFLSSTSSDQVKNSCIELAKCIHTYKTHNGKLPDWILIYRYGLSDVDEFETKVIEACIDELYAAEEMESPKFTYVVVSKKVSPQLLADRGGRVENISPGTTIDDTLTRQERYYFFLVSASGRQSSISPCQYNVIRDTSGIEADKLQLLTYKLCHLYFNSVAVPAPCQYARKLAALTAVAYERSAHSNLSELRYYL